MRLAHCVHGVCAIVLLLLAPNAPATAQAQGPQPADAHHAQPAHEPAGAGPVAPAPGAAAPGVTAPGVTAPPAAPALEPVTPETGALSSDLPGEAPPTAAEAVDGVQSDGASAASDASVAPARLVFFRPSGFSGAIYTYHVVQVGEDGASTPDTPRIGSLPNGGYFQVEMKPGQYYFNIRGPMAANLAKDRLQVEAPPGATIYIEQIIRVGLITGGFQLIRATEADFRRRRLTEWKPGAE